MKKPCIAIKVGDHLIPRWVENMSKLLPEFDVVSWHEDPEKENVEYVIGWCPDAIWINTFPNIKAVVSVGSGVDHIINLEKLNKSIPIIRTVSNDLIQRVREFVTLCVLSWHRQLPAILENKKTKKWNRYSRPISNEINVGILGYGSMGKTVADTLHFLDYNVSVWASSNRTINNYRYFFGDTELNEFASGLDIVICLLPLTKNTENILNNGLMKKLNRGACVMNFSRGAHLVDQDLYDLLDEGHISAAYLDGYRTEPLPEDSELFLYDNINITFHSAGYISPEIGPQLIAKNIRKFNDGKEVCPMFDRTKGY